MTFLLQKKINKTIYLITNMKDLRSYIYKFTEILQKYNNKKISREIC